MAMPVVRGLEAQVKRKRLEGQTYCAWSALVILRLRIETSGDGSGDVSARLIVLGRRTRIRSVTI